MNQEPSFSRESSRRLSWIQKRDWRWKNLWGDKCKIVEQYSCRIGKKTLSIHLKTAIYKHILPKYIHVNWSSNSSFSHRVTLILNVRSQLYFNSSSALSINLTSDFFTKSLVVVYCWWPWELANVALVRKRRKPQRLLFLQKHHRGCESLADIIIYG